MSYTLDADGTTNVCVDRTTNAEQRTPYLPLFLMSQGNAPYMSPTSIEETSYCVEITTEQGRAWDMGQYMSHNDAYIAAQRIADEWNSVPNARVYVVTRHVSVWNTVSSHVVPRRAQS